MGSSLHLPRQRQPELELEYARSPTLGYEPPEDTGIVRCLTHGYPTPLARWHFHDEYELHLIVATSGKAFVGDWIGPFAPGHLVLCGPRLPHNWISFDVPHGGVEQRDLVIQFPHEPIAQAAQHISELCDLMPLLDRARYGIEFFGMAESAKAHWQHIKRSRGLERFAAFCTFVGELARCSDYRLLSSVRMEGESDDAGFERINRIAERITADLTQPLSAALLADELGMSETRFSRFFRQATGNTFTNYVNRVRVSHACHLLMESDRRITHICYEVGFNNVANFNRRFLEIKGMTPSEFRSQAAKRFRSTG
jgi:AraC-like DNA-binding protein